MWEVFDTISAMKKAYAGLQKAHSPWDPEKMRVADVAVVGELRKLGVLRERFRKRCSYGGGARGGGGPVVTGTLREVVAPYEVTVEELKKEVKAKEVEVDNLKEKLSVVNGSTGNSGKKGRSLSRRKVGCSQLQVVATPAPDLFEATMSQVKEASKSFTSLLLSLMRAALWDIAAAVCSIESATLITTTTTTIIYPPLSQRRKMAMPSMLCSPTFLAKCSKFLIMRHSTWTVASPCCSTQISTAVIASPNTVT